MSTTITPPKDHAEKVERLRLTLARIESHPDNWNQEDEHCGTSHCFAGHAELLARGLPPDMSELGLYQSIGFDRRSARVVCEQWCGLSDDEIKRLYRTTNTLEDLRRIVAEIAESHSQGG